MPTQRHQPSRCSRSTVQTTAVATTRRVCAHGTRSISIGRASAGIVKFQVPVALPVVAAPSESSSPADASEATSSRVSPQGRSDPAALASILQQQSAMLASQADVLAQVQQEQGSHGSVLSTMATQLSAVASTLAALEARVAALSPPVASA